MQLKEIFALMTTEEIERLFEHLQSARGLFVAAMPYTSEVKRMLNSDEYTNLTFMTTSIFAELQRRELQTIKEQHNEN